MIPRRALQLDEDLLFISCRALSFPFRDTLVEMPAKPLPRAELLLVQRVREFRGYPNSK